MTEERRLIIDSIEVNQDEAIVGVASYSKITPKPVTFNMFTEADYADIEARVSAHLDPGKMVMMDSINALCSAPNAPKVIIGTVGKTHAIDKALLDPKWQSVMNKTRDQIIEAMKVPPQYLGQIHAWDSGEPGSLRTYNHLKRIEVTLSIPGDTLCYEIPKESEKYLLENPNWLENKFKLPGAGEPGQILSVAEGGTGWRAATPGGQSKQFQSTMRIHGNMPVKVVFPPDGGIETGRSSSYKNAVNRPSRENHNQIIQMTHPINALGHIPQPGDPISLDVETFQTPRMAKFQMGGKDGPWQMVRASENARGSQKRLVNSAGQELPVRIPGQLKRDQLRELYSGDLSEAAINAAIANGFNTYAGDSDCTGVTSLEDALSRCAPGRQPVPGGINLPPLLPSSAIIAIEEALNNQAPQLVPSEYAEYEPGEQLEQHRTINTENKLKAYPLLLPNAALLTMSGTDLNMQIYRHGELVGQDMWKQPLEGKELLIARLQHATTLKHRAYKIQAEGGYWLPGNLNSTGHRQFVSLTDQEIEKLFGET